jgi:SAM-dependent methyltransferase
MSNNERRKVCSTTWPGRHDGTFTELRNQLDRAGILSPVVLEVGPGAASKMLAGMLAAGEGEKLSWLGNRWRAVLRNVDGLIRRIPNCPLHSYEPGELLSFLPAGAKLTVADISEPVIRAIEKQYPQVSARVIDFTSENITPPVDVVVCFCVLTRARQPREIFANLYQSIKPGGFLVMDSRSRKNFSSAEHVLEEITGHIWRKTN